MEIYRLIIIDFSRYQFQLSERILPYLSSSLLNGILPAL